MLFCIHQFIFLFYHSVYVSILIWTYKPVLCNKSDDMIFRRLRLWFTLLWNYVFNHTSALSWEKVSKNNNSSSCPVSAIFSCVYSIKCTEAPQAVMENNRYEILKILQFLSINSNNKSFDHTYPLISIFPFCQHIGKLTTFITWRKLPFSCYTGLIWTKYHLNLWIILLTVWIYHKTHSSVTLWRKSAIGTARLRKWI